MFRTLTMLAWITLMGCRENDSPEDAAALLDRVEADGYRDWARAPGYEMRRATSAPHGDAVEIFVNEVVSAALAEPPENGTYPEGSVIVKDQFDDEGMLVFIAIMEKRADGWFWAEYDESGEPLYSGAPSLCTDCHASGVDFVRAFPLE